tara:strand:+ start:1789 stop:2754 length:966 start_codon:yes stop_codon:yes gene_type:complete
VINKYREIIEKRIKNISLDKYPESLYEPIKYFFGLGGKRIRPALTMMSCEAFGCNPTKALDAALSVETFHNFTLIHDDIMDSAETRRNEDTVHKKWNLNKGILSGDRMLILAYQLLENYDSKMYHELTILLNKTAEQVCEGQQLDIDFESKLDTTYDQYIEMITLKTAVLLGCSLKMGAIIAESSIENQDEIYDFGINLGLAFQLQDDYLDVFGEESKIGKKVGGDILENKKTVLFHIALSKSNQKNKNKLISLYNAVDKNEEKILKVKSIFKESESHLVTKKIIKDYTMKALNNLEKLNIGDEKKQNLVEFSNKLMNREL